MRSGDELSKNAVETEAGTSCGFYSVFIKQETMDEPSIDAEPVNDPLESVTVKPEETQDPSSSNRINEKDGDEKIIDCTVASSDCGQKFEALFSHMLTHSDNCGLHSLKKRIPQQLPSKIFECTCGKVFRDKRLLKRHAYCHTEEKPHACQVCGKRFGQSCTLKTHMLTHTGEKRFACTECGKAFTQASNLNSHMLLHAGAKRYRCTQCGKGYAQTGELNAHLLTHSAEKRYTCTVCGKGFTKTSNYNTHMLTHTGEKNYGCDVCGKKFIQRSNYRIHLLTHVKEKNFKCEMCDKKFSGKPLLNVHIRKSHLINTDTN